MLSDEPKFGNFQTNFQKISPFWISLLGKNFDIEKDKNLEKFINEKHKQKLKIK